MKIISIWIIYVYQNIKLDPLIKIALDLGLNPGPIFGKLSKGESITLDNGKVITLKDVLDEPLPSSSLAILYILAEEYMNQMLKNVL